MADGGGIATQSCRCLPLPCIGYLTPLVEVKQYSSPHIHIPTSINKTKKSRNQRSGLIRYKLLCFFISGVKLWHFILLLRIENKIESQYILSWEWRIKLKANYPRGKKKKKVKVKEAIVDPFCQTLQAVRLAKLMKV